MAGTVYAAMLFVQGPSRHPYCAFSGQAKRRATCVSTVFRWAALERLKISSIWRFILPLMNHPGRLGPGLSLMVVSRRIISKNSRVPENDPTKLQKQNKTLL